MYVHVHVRKCTCVLVYPVSHVRFLASMLNTCISMYGLIPKLCYPMIHTCTHIICIQIMERDIFLDLLSKVQVLHACTCICSMHTRSSQSIHVHIHVYTQVSA